MELNLKNKTVLVTGGGAGLGAGICEVFAEEGANVMVNYIINQADVIKFVESLNQRYGGKHMAIYGDITNADDIDNMIRVAEKE